MATSKQFLDLLLSQDGDRYVFGVEVSATTDNPTAFDCSELVEWACNRLHITPRMPDGSWYQVRHCKNNGTLISVEQGRMVAGALLFRFSGDPFTGGRPRSAHVAVSQGNGRTIEARSRHYGVGQFTAYGRGWTHAGLIPGLHIIEVGDDMKPGDTGLNVKKLQNYLNRWIRDRNIVADELTEDGDYGLLTENMVKVFQRWATLETTGVANPLTLATLAALVVPK